MAWSGESSQRLARLSITSSPAGLAASKSRSAKTCWVQTKFHAQLFDWAGSLRFADRSAIPPLIGGSVVRFGGVDLDATLELRAVFDANARRGNVADDRSIALDVDTVASVHIADHFSVDDIFACMNLRSELRRGPDGESVAAQRDGSIYFSIDLQIFSAGDVSLDLQAGTKTRGAACGATSERRNRSQGVAEGDDRRFCCLR